ncbi:MAG TPA: hypothetical protein VJ914_11710 [Pseudonocardiaceae bacterium]|nr:hypothetical protein [Pseudonocardiaceae bacterium]
MTWPPAGGREEWDQLRPGLHIGERLMGTVAWLPKPGAIGFGVHLGLPIGGFVDALLLPDTADRWPEIGTVADFEVWAMDKRRPQIRRRPVDPAYLRSDFNEWVRRFRLHAGDSIR